MKKITILKLTLFFIAVTVLAVGCGKVSSDGDNADWTPISLYIDNPDAAAFTVSTAEELALLAQITNGTCGGTPERDNFSGKVVKLSRNIDLSGYDNWIPIGNYGFDHNSGVENENMFSGTFDGCGYVISNLAINRQDENYQGLFGFIYTGSVKNLGLDNVNVSGGGHIGSLAGAVFNGTIVNCYSTGTVSGIGRVSGGAAGDIGGIVGELRKNSGVSNSYFSGIVNGHVIDDYIPSWGSPPGIYWVGGVVGTVIENSYVANSYSTGTVSGTSEVGGAVGRVINGHITNSYSAGAVSGAGSVGGVAGYVAISSVINCAALNPEVKGAGEEVGRVAGRIANGTFSNNAAYSGMKNRYGNTAWFSKSAEWPDGADITAADIKADGTLGGRFNSKDGWTTKNGRFPGFGMTLAIEEEWARTAISIPEPKTSITAGKCCGGGLDDLLGLDSSKNVIK